MTRPLPIVHSLVVSDHVHFDDQTEKAYVLGVRLEIEPETFPYEHPLIVIYIALGGGRGQVKLTLRIIDIGQEQEEIFAEQEVIAPFADPLLEVEVALYFPDLVFPGPSEYRVQLFADDQFLHERRLSVLPARQSDES